MRPMHHGSWQVAWPGPFAPRESLKFRRNVNALVEPPWGGAVVTTGGRLKARWAIHAVGPRWGEGDEEEKLRQATVNSLRRATEKGMRSVTFPAISTGIFAFPKELCAKIMLKTVLDFLAGKETSVERVVFCLWSPEDLSLFPKTLRTL